MTIVMVNFISAIHCMFMVGKVTAGKSNRGATLLIRRIVYPCHTGAAK